jgi:hypothetical protein
MKIGSQPEKWLRKKARQGMRGYPVGTIAFYGPDRDRATKVAASVIRFEGTEPEVLRLVSEAGDVRKEDAILPEITAHLRASAVHSIAMVDRIIGCPHEEGTDYPMGESCPRCSYWERRDRWSDEWQAGLVLHGQVFLWRSRWGLRRCRVCRANRINRPITSWGLGAEMRKIRVRLKTNFTR